MLAHAATSTMQARRPSRPGAGTPPAQPTRPSGPTSTARGPDPRPTSPRTARRAGPCPRGPEDLGDRLRLLPPDGSVPGAPGWRWLHTPGHTPGHVSLWGEEDRTLAAGDAVVTTRQESAYAVAAQSPELHGPPACFTPDWAAAEASARRLAAPEPELLMAGHGRPMRGSEMREALVRLARDFRQIAVPEAKAPGGQASG